MIDNSDFVSDNEEELSSELQELESREGELYLRFYVASGEEFALPAISIREVMQQAPDRITPIPNSSPLLLGTINLRGQVMWVADLGQFLGDSKNLNTQRQEIPIIAIEAEDIILGLAIDKLGQMDWRDIEQIEKPTHTAEQMELFVLGEWLLNEETEQVIRLLDHRSILRSARWAA